MVMVYPYIVEIYIEDKSLCLSQRKLIVKVKACHSIDAILKVKELTQKLNQNILIEDVYLIK